MANTRAHALVIGYRGRDLRRFAKQPPAEIEGGKCISCGEPVYFNPSGIDAIRSRDADVCCVQCDYQFDADIRRSMVES